MDDEQVQELRTWAQRLATDDRADVRAAGRAIVMLADELSALRARRRQEDGQSVAAPTAAETDASSTDVASSLRGRLRSFVGGRDAAPARPGDGETGSRHVHG